MNIKILEMEEKDMITKRKPIYRVTFIMLLMIFPIIILGKLYQFNMLNGYAFGIINRIINWLPTDVIPTDNSYAFPLKFYRLFSFLPFTTPLEWAIFWAVVMNIIFFIIFLKKYKTYSFEEYIFIYASMFILDVFVFNINKDLVQCLMLLIVFLLMNLKISDWIKILLASLVLFIESIYFRSYYILGAAASIIVCFVLSIFTKKNKNQKSSVTISIILILLLLFFMIFVAQYIKPEAYQELIGRRDTIVEDLDANTVISDWIPGDGYYNYCINYIINLFRMCFPLELLFKGIKYLPFVIYQIYLAINIIKNIKYINKKNLSNISFIIGYWLMMFASESDFGTLVRHQAILLPFYLDMIRENKEKRKNHEKN